MAHLDEDYKDRLLDDYRRQIAELRVENAKLRNEKQKEDKENEKI